MRSFSSRLELSDIRSSWHSANQIPISTFAYISSSNLVKSTISAAFRRTRRGRGRVLASGTLEPSIRSPEIRRPRDPLYPGNGLSLGSFHSASTSSSPDDLLLDMDLFLELVPLRMRNALFRHEEIAQLIEVVMDLGRKPLARFPSGDWIISEHPVKQEDLSHAISKVGDFSDDNRSGINQSLHRISAIRNRKLQIIGLTCRVGRAVSGSAEIMRDLVEGGGSILVIGPPGVGKTTLIREIARMLADDHNKRVVIVDTSNEIGGDGDVPHSGIGRARRMQVPNVHMQHNVMIEAVENHMPESIIIDEIGTELEALAASTIAQRGVQLVATAHGVTIESIIKNPSLQILVGGIESVTLGDDEAKKRKVQKTILERKGPATFTCAVEMISRTECRVHHRLDATVDAILAGKSQLFEVRRMDEETNDSLISSPVTSKDEEVNSPSLNNEDKKVSAKSVKEVNDYYKYENFNNKREKNKSKATVHVYTFKIQDVDLLQVATVMGLDDELDVTDDIGGADVILASGYDLKRNSWIRGIAKLHGLPIFVIKSNTMAQMVKAIRMILGMDLFGSKSSQPVEDSFDIEIEEDAPKRKPSLEEIDALEEVRLAIEYIVIPGGEPVELLPRRSDIVARQLELVESYQLAAENSGTETHPRLQILPQKLLKKSTLKPGKPSSNPSMSDTTNPSITSGSGSSFPRLPLLPE